MIIEQFICRTDNYAVLIHDPESGLTASIDAPEEKPIRDKLAEKGWKLDRIFNTHHHADHVEGNEALKAAFECKIVGPAREAEKIPGIDEAVTGGKAFMFGEYEIRVIDTPGHTLGHVCYWVPSANVAFVADTLFSLGCGRLLEGTPEMMFSSLKKLRTLPDETKVYCGHEYTEKNARFAIKVDPDNPNLAARAEAVKRLRSVGRPTLPTTIGLEKATNPFLRADTPGVRRGVGMEDADVIDVFAELRRRRDRVR